MKKPISASRAKKQKELKNVVIPLIEDRMDTYLDRAIIHALHENNISVSYRGTLVYLTLHKGVSYSQVMSLPKEDEFLKVLKEELKIDLAPFIVKHRESDCFTCGMMQGKCLDPKTCGNIMKKNKSKQQSLIL